MRRALHIIRRIPAHTPLRLQLVAALLSLLAIALVVTGVAGTRTLKTYLVQRVDQQLTMTAQQDPSHRPGFDPGDNDEQQHNGGDSYQREGPALVNAFFREVVDDSGAGAAQLQLPSGSTQKGPKLPTLSADEQTRLGTHPFTTAAKGGSGEWRVLIRPVNDTQSLVVATSMSDVDSTVHRLAVIDGIVSGIVLAVLLFVGYGLVWSSLRGLRRVETTAEAIAAGDLTKRIEIVSARTEVGRLSVALNTMLGQIESSFEVQHASETQARESEERMRRFVADASHELRTPLTSIRGFSEISRQQDNVDRSLLLNRIEGEATRMSVLVEDLLLLARLDQQRPLEHQPVDLVDVAADAIANAPALAPNHNVQLVFEDNEDEPYPVVLGDELRLRQVLTNLLANAYVYTPAGTDVTVQVCTADGRAIVEVIDNGPGMDDESARRAFERFYRSDASRTRASGGAGLGLSIVAGIVSAQEGTIELESSPGNGAHFTISLPLFRSAD